MNKILLSSALAVLLLAGCTEEKKTSAEVTVKEEAQTVENVKNEIVEATQEASKETAKTVTTETNEAVNATTETINKTVDSAAQVVKETAESVIKTTDSAIESTSSKIEEAKEATKQIVTETKEVASKAAEEAKKMFDSGMEKASDKIEDVKEKAVEEPVAAASSVNAEALYKACAACHGLNGEKPALGKSQIIAGWDKEKTIEAMNGYKDGSYGGAMKNIMKGQVTSKTDLEIEALAEFISKM